MNRNREWYIDRIIEMVKRLEWTEDEGNLNKVKVIYELLLRL